MPDITRVFHSNKPVMDRMKLSDFDYFLPEELISQYPSGHRDGCRLMVLDRKMRSVEHKIFGDIADYFKAGDCLVLNDTRVIWARLLGRRKTLGKVELFLLEKKGPVCEALVRPSKRIKEGEKISLESGMEVEILGPGEVGRIVRFDRPIDEVLAYGHVPLPPYIDRSDEESDRSAYQTVYAKKEGATASPTAGLHFTLPLIDRIASRGVRIAYVTLHTSYGTFAPVKTEDVASHKMHRERFELSSETVRVVNETKRRGGKIFAVGTTSLRVLEHCSGLFTPHSAPLQTPHEDGYTDLYIYPGYEFKIVDAMITNFHLPKSTLMLLVSAFAGRKFILDAYRRAVEECYAFFSYGDAMLIL